MVNWLIRATMDGIDIVHRYGKLSFCMVLVSLNVSSHVKHILTIFSFPAGHQKILLILIFHGGEFTSFLGRK